MTFERTRNYDLVRAIFCHPRIFPHIGDDSTGTREEFQVNKNPLIWYVLVHHWDEMLGLIAFVPRNSATYEVHCCLLPEAWGWRARLAAKDLRAWMWNHSPARRIVAQVPAFNRLALNFAKDAGMVEYGVNERALLKGGKMHDLICLGVSKDN